MGDLFNKHLKKATARTKGKLLVGLGKAKATHDEAFDFHAVNLTKQTKTAERLAKDLKAYVTALKGIHVAEKALRETLRDVYEPEWPGRDHVISLTQSLDWHTGELEKSVTEQIPAAVTQHLTQLEDLKAKCAKRGRKLVDYDAAKHEYDNVVQHSKRPEADPKVAKVYAELQSAEQLYREVNNELLQVLPATYDNRITFLVDTLQTLFNAHSAHQLESAEVNKMLITHLDELGHSAEQLRVARPESSPSPLPPGPVSAEAGDTGTVDNSSTTPSRHSSSAGLAVEPAKVEAAASRSPTPSRREVPENREPPIPSPRVRESVAVVVEKQTIKEASTPSGKKSTNPFDSEEESEPIETVTPKGNEEKASTPGGEREILYRVRSTHAYNAEDADELSFGAKEIIEVLTPLPTDDELDAGWRLGRRAADPTKKTGVFPENFTKKWEDETN